MTDARRIFSEKRRLILPIAIALVVNMALFAIVLYPLSKKVAGSEQESNAATTTLNAAKRDYQQARATVAGKGQADQELQKFYTDVLPPDISAATPHYVPAHGTAGAAVQSPPRA